jgi:hypothetical protein
MTFDYWLARSRDNWMPRVCRELGLGKRRVERALREFVAANSGRDYRELLRTLNAERGIGNKPVLGSGETTVLTVKLGEDHGT